MRRSLTSQAGLLTGSRALGQILNALAGLVVVRALAQFDYGTYRQILLLWTTLFLVGDAAFSQSLYQFIPSQRKDTRTYLGQALAASLVMASAWSVGLVLLAASIGRFFNNADLAGYMKLLAAYLACSLFTKAPEAALINLERVGAVALNTACFETLKVAMVLGVLRAHGGINALLWAMLLSTVLKLTHLLWLLRGTGLSLALGSFGVQFQYAMLLWLPGLLNIAATYAHQYIVGFYFDPARYAIYAVACFQVPFMGVLSTSVGEILLVRATEYHAQRRQTELLQVWHNACRKALLIFIPVVIACAALAGPFITTLFTLRYRASAPLFIPIVLGLGFSGLFQDSMLRAYGAMRAYAGFYILRVVLALGLGVAGARWWGLWGAALSTLASLTILNFSQLIKVAALLEAPFSRVLPWPELGRICLVSGLAAGPAALAASQVSRPMFALLVGAGVFGAVFALLAPRLGAVRAEESREFTLHLRAAAGRLGILPTKVSV
jgi:O-antigen/teichoic acid export membrane protein